MLMIFLNFKTFDFITINLKNSSKKFEMKMCIQICKKHISLLLLSFTITFSHIMCEHMYNSGYQHPYPNLSHKTLNLFALNFKMTYIET